MAGYNNLLDAEKERTMIRIATLCNRKEATIPYLA
jgi:hypothetical protein